ncbi:MAG TPA: ATP-binding cassette domain-containing protein, partial [Prevotella sp.]
MQPLIELHNVSAGYNGRNVLQNVTLSIYENDFLGVIGPNGGGKTTLMRVLLGLMKPTAGTVSYYNNGVPATGIAMGYLPQYSEIDKHFPISVADVVLSGLSSEKPLLRPFSKDQRAQAAQTLERMELSALANRPIGTLSGGQLQRVLLARA